MHKPTPYQDWEALLAQARGENDELREENEKYKRWDGDWVARDEYDSLREVLEQLAHPTMDAHELAHLSDMQQEDVTIARRALEGSSDE